MIKTILINKYKKIDQFRPILPFFIFFVTLDIVFSFSTLVTTSYPFFFAFVLTPELEKNSPVMYGVLFFTIKLVTFSTPFILTFFVLDHALSGMMSIQRYEQKLIQRLIDWRFRKKYREKREDAIIPKWLEKLGMITMSVNTWFNKKKVWQQYMIILSMFVLSNPMVVSLPLIFY